MRKRTIISIWFCALEIGTVIQTALTTRCGLEYFVLYSIFFSNECNVWYARDPQPIRQYSTTESPYTQHNTHTNTNTCTVVGITAMCQMWRIPLLLVSRSILHISNVISHRIICMFECDIYSFFCFFIIETNSYSNQLIWFQEQCKRYSTDCSQLSCVVAFFSYRLPYLFQTYGNHFGAHRIVN